MSNRAVLCRVVPCCAMFCRVVPCCAVLCRVVPCFAVLCRVLSCCAVSYQVISGCFGTARPYKTNFSLGSTESFHTRPAPRPVRHDWLEFDLQNKVPRRAKPNLAVFGVKYCITHAF